MQILLLVPVALPLRLSCLLFRFLRCMLTVKRRRLRRRSVSTYVISRRIKSVQLVPITVSPCLQSTARNLNTIALWVPQKTGRAHTSASILPPSRASTRFNLFPNHTPPKAQQHYPSMRALRHPRTSPSAQPTMALNSPTDVHVCPFNLSIC